MSFKEKIYWIQVINQGYLKNFNFFYHFLREFLFETHLTLFDILLAI
jgi:hypothetical protein